MKDKDQQLIWETYQQLNEEFSVDDAANAIIAAWKKREDKIDNDILSASNDRSGTEDELMQQIQSDIAAVKADFWSNVEMILEMVPRNEWREVYKAVLDAPDKSFGEIDWRDVSELSIELTKWMKERGTDSGGLSSDDRPGSPPSTYR